MTSNQAAKDRQIYDDYVRLCRDIQDDLKSVVGRSQVILSLSIAALVGYFVIADRSFWDASILELIGLGTFLLGTLPFVRQALRIERFDSPRLKLRLRYDTIENITWAVLLSISELAQRLMILRKNRARIYHTSLRIWAASLIIGVMMVVAGIIQGSDIEADTNSISQNISETTKQGEENG